MSTWITERLAREAAREDRHAVRVAQEQRDALLVETLSGKFFSDAVRALRSEMSAISPLKLEGSVVEVASPLEGPQIYRLCICCLGYSYRVQYATFQFDRPGRGPALFRLDDGANANIRLVAVNDSAIGALWSLGQPPLSAADLASAIVRNLVDQLKPECK